MTEQWLIVVLGLSIVFLNVFLRSFLLGLSAIGCFITLLFMNPIPAEGAVALDYWKQFPFWFLTFGYLIYIGGRSEHI